MAGIYIHVPFCASRCIYCAFYTTTSLSSQDLLVQALCSELAMRRDYLLDKAAPSLPPARQPHQHGRANILRRTTKLPAQTA